MLSHAKRASVQRLRLGVTSGNNKTKEKDKTMINTRTMNYGRKTELERQAMQLRVEIDAQVKAMFVHLEPLDWDLQYTEKILPDRMQIYVAAISKKVKDLHRVLVELKCVKTELGEES
jgi:hypothetical protein